MEIGLQIPDDIAADIRKANGQDIAWHILEAYVIQAYHPTLTPTSTFEPVRKNHPD